MESCQFCGVLLTEKAAKSLPCNRCPGCGHIFSNSHCEEKSSHDRINTIRSIIADIKTFDLELPDREGIIANFHETVAALESEIKGLEELL